jgi:hypothetical protein
MDALVEDFADERVKSIFVYTREAHPGEHRGPHVSHQDKIERGRELRALTKCQRPVMADDLGGTVHRAYGMLPNMTYVIARGGAIVYRASWTDARTVRLALESLADARRIARQGRRVMPYFVQWQPVRNVERKDFFAGLYEIGGPRAAREYIDSVAAAYGEDYARPFERLWDAAQADSES